MLKRLKCLLGLHAPTVIVDWRRHDGREYAVHECLSCNKRFWG